MKRIENGKPLYSLTTPNPQPRMNYYCFDIQIADEYADILLALLSMEDFEAFEETDTGLKGYLAEHKNLAEAEQLLDQLRERFPFSYSQNLHREKNWNAVWESNFRPIQIENFCGIRAVFHPEMLDVQHEIVIQPKMSFGTGHHATTFMMIQMMEEVDFTGKSVWDFGSGTGILAILAAKMGATQLLANDIDNWAYDNALENIQTNDTPHIQVVHGGLDAVPRHQYDIILANITLNVISPALPSLYEQLAANGVLIISGFLQDDIASLSAKAQTLGLRLHAQRTHSEWACLHFNK